MKPFILFLFVLLTLFPGIISCSTEKPELLSQTEHPIEPNMPDIPEPPGHNDNNNAMSN